MARVLSSCGFNNWSFSRLFSASLGYYSPLLSCKSQSVNAFRQIDSSVLEVCDNSSTLSAPCSLSPNLSNSVVHSVNVWKTSWCYLRETSILLVLLTYYSRPKNTLRCLSYRYLKTVWLTNDQCPIYVKKISNSGLKIVMQASQGSPVFQFLCILVNQLSKGTI